MYGQYAILHFNQSSLSAMQATLCFYVLFLAFNADDLLHYKTISF